MSVGTSLLNFSAPTALLIYSLQEPIMEKNVPSQDVEPFRSRPPPPQQIELGEPANNSGGKLLVALIHFKLMHFD